MNDLDKLIANYEQILREKDKEIKLLQSKLLTIRGRTKDKKIRRLTHFPPYET